MICGSITIVAYVTTYCLWRKASIDVTSYVYLFITIIIQIKAITAIRGRIILWEQDMTWDKILENIIETSKKDGIISLRISLWKIKRRDNIIHTITEKNKKREIIYLVIALRKETCNNIIVNIIKKIKW